MASGPKPSNRAAYAIQEILKHCGCDKTTPNLDPKRLTTEQEKGFQVWSRFSPEVKQAITSFLSSQYHVEIKNKTTIEAAPIYKPHMRYNLWVTLWTKKLINQSNSPIFMACRNVISDNIEISCYLLPHLILHLLLSKDSPTSQEKKDIKTEILTVLEGSAVGGILGRSSSESLGNNTFTGLSDQQSAVQRVFSIIDYLQKWSEDNSIARSYNGRKSDPKDVRLLLQEIPQRTMVNASYNCKAYYRSLMHYELHLKQQSDKVDTQQIISNDIGFLQKIYAGMDEPDCLIGLLSMKTGATLEEQITKWEASENWRNVLMGYDQILKLSPDDPHLLQGRLMCLKSMGLHQLMLDLSEKILSDLSLKQHHKSILPFAIQASWNLENWILLEKYLKQPREYDFEASVGELLTAIRNKDRTKFDSLMKSTIEKIISRIKIQRVYPLLTELHILNEMESAFDTQSKVEPTSVSKNWKNRLLITQPLFKTREPILSVRSKLCSILHIKEDINIWLDIAKEARKGEQLERASYALSKANTFTITPRFILEKAKWLWSIGNQYQAVHLLQTEIDRWGTVTFQKSVQLNKHLSPIPEEMMRIDITLCLAKWMERSGLETQDRILQLYSSVLCTEKAFFKFASFLDNLMREIKKATANESKSTHWEYLPTAIAHYGNAMLLGTTFIYNSMPRFISLWLDSFDKPTSKIRETLQESIKGIVEMMIKKLPTYLWFISFPQLIGRVCISGGTRKMLESIIVKLLVAFPMQSIWQFLSLKFYNTEDRRERYKEIKRNAISSSRLIEPTFNEAELLGKHLLELSILEISDKNVTSFDMSAKCPALTSRAFNLMIPTEKQLTVTLQTGGPSSNHLPFTTEPVTIKKIQNEVQLLTSAIRPKKFSVEGSDGKIYTFLNKPKDDLRRDCRMMEFNNLLNKLLKKNPASRKRELHIRTYAVIPLNEQCGLIEWVPNTIPYRSILLKIYTSIGLDTKKRRGQTEDLYKKNPSGISVGQWQEICNLFPLAFYKWFYLCFPEPAAWFKARLAYARTTAVMSMVGSIVGLGDRHGENILFDSSSGDAVHVDFNCVFDKGKDFKVSEKVPFRLTRNMVDALGLTGYEGTFRKVCEITMTLLRHHKYALLSILVTFIHDPLFDWKKPKKDEPGLSVAKETVKDVEDRLEGKLRHSHNRSQILLPLSIEAQVQALIQEAVKPDNLAAMFVGWASYL
eukprot:TRINITY_DN6811_c0_g1_i1.p1 TRINITY_DN6811_c0_g1~~TRINITY_DN6811_c0_g1_i1.p1  ORF type:complete len:1336 (-),score=309.61 TRINITY_DN6811_c0_g1_i1:7-3633(-)